MKSNRRYVGRALTLVATLLASNCGVEVGNPHPKPGTGGTGTGTTGALTLALADAPVDDAKSVFLNIIGMRVVPESEAELGTPVAVTLANAGKIDALALRDGKSLDLSSNQAIPLGSYAGVILDLDAASPATIVGADGVEHPLNFPDAGQGIYVAQGFEAVEGEEVKVTLHVDLRRSITKLEEGGNAHRFNFGPVAHMVRQADQGMIVGAAQPAAFATVCAYLRRSNDFNNGAFGRIPRGPGGPGGGPGGKGSEKGAAGAGKKHHDGPPPPGFDGGRPRADAKIPPSFGPEGDVSTDKDASCANAFATAAVSGGAYTLAHLWPGEYRLLFFAADGAPVAQDAVIVRLAPGQKVELGAP